MRWVKVEDTLWPVDDADDSLQWQLRYAPVSVGVERFAAIASVMTAYAALCDPGVSQGTAIEMLKRARRAHLTRPGLPEEGATE